MGVRVGQLVAAFLAIFSVYLPWYHFTVSDLANWNTNLVDLYSNVDMFASLISEVSGDLYSLPLVGSGLSDIVEGIAPLIYTLKNALLITLVLIGLGSLSALIVAFKSSKSGYWVAPVLWFLALIVYTGGLYAICGMPCVHLSMFGVSLGISFIGPLVLFISIIISASGK